MNFFNWIFSLWNGRNLKAKNEYQHPPITFHFCEVVKTPPSNDLIPFGKFFVVIPSQEPKWALFKCPCGCGHVITLALASGRKPRWHVTHGKGIYPTLHPSVRQLTGCYSHFWLRSGRIHWCADTGKPHQNGLDVY